MIASEGGRGAAKPAARSVHGMGYFGGGDDTASSSSNSSIRAFRAQIAQFELFELILLLKLGKQFPAEQFEATVISVKSTLPPS